jgi:putative flippase GtrA
MIREAVGYAAASGVALAVDVGILTVLVKYFSWWYLAAAATSFVAGLILAYVLSLRWAFTKRRLKNERAEFAAFAALGLAGLIINGAVMFGCVRLLGLHYLAAKGAASGCTFLSNFVSRRQLLFTR